MAVLARLGDDNLVMLKENLKSQYKIDLDSEDSFTLEELQIALQRFLGDHGARLLITEIVREIKEIART